MKEEMLVRRPRPIAALAVVLLAAVALAGCSLPGSAPKFPDPAKPIVIIVPYAPGGGSDNLARTAVKFLNQKKIISNTFQVENRAGASGATGMAHFIDTYKGNPYALMPVVTQVLSPKIRGDAKYDYNDMTLVARIGIDDHVVLVKKESAFQSVKDLVAEAKKRKVTVGGTGVGATDHLTALTMGQAAGVELAYVPFQSGGEVTTALLGGHVDFIINNPNESLEQIKSGKFRALAIAAEKRSELLPDVPTLKEQGINAVFQLFRGFAAPPGIPEDALKFYEQAFKKLFDDPDYQKEYLKANGIAPAYLNGADFKRYLDDQSKVWTGLLTKAGLVKK